MAEFTNVRVGTFESYKRAMFWYRRGSRPVTPQSLAAFGFQLTNNFGELATLNFGNIFAGIIGFTPEEGTTLLFILPEVKK